jgi:hypothetical protein
LSRCLRSTVSDFPFLPDITASRVSRMVGPTDWGTSARTQCAKRCDSEVLPSLSLVGNNHFLQARPDPYDHGGAAKQTLDGESPFLEVFSPSTSRMPVATCIGFTSPDCATSSGFLNLLTFCSTGNLEALFHASSVPGVLRFQRFPPPSRRHGFRRALSHLSFHHRGRRLDFKDWCDWEIRSSRSGV